MTNLSRHLVSSPTGKLTASVPTFKIDEETFESANILARKAGMSLSEWVRTLVMVRVHGVNVVIKMHEARLRVVAGMDSQTIGGGDD